MSGKALRALALELRLTRVAKGLTIRQVAAAAEVCAKTLERAERGLHVPHPHNLRRIAVVLNSPALNALVDAIAPRPGDGAT